MAKDGEKSPELRSKKWELGVSIGAVIFTAWMGMIQLYFKQQNDHRHAVWEERLHVYREALDVSAALAASPPEAREEETLRFWSLYYGQMCLMEDHGVEQAMVALGEALRTDDPSNMEKTIKQLSLDLAYACRESLQDTWNPVVLGELEHNKR
jgi:hypothetical protein